MIIEETLQVLNGNQVANKKFNFRFGQSIILPLRSAMSRLKAALLPINVLVGHSLNSDERFLRQFGMSFKGKEIFDTQTLTKTLTGDYSSWRLSKIIEFVGCKLESSSPPNPLLPPPLPLAPLSSPPPSPSTLSSTLSPTIPYISSPSLPTLNPYDGDIVRDLHNAGNDSHWTMVAFLGLAVGGGGAYLAHNQALNSSLASDHLLSLDPSPFSSSSSFPSSPSQVSPFPHMSLPNPPRKWNLTLESRLLKLENESKGWDWGIKSKFNDGVTLVHPFFEETEVIPILTGDPSSSTSSSSLLGSSSTDSSKEINLSSEKDDGIEGGGSMSIPSIRNPLFALEEFLMIQNQSNLPSRPVMYKKEPRLDKVVHVMDSRMKSEKGVEVMSLESGLSKLGL